MIIICQFVYVNGQRRGYAADRCRQPRIGVGTAKREKCTLTIVLHCDPLIISCVKSLKRLLKRELHNTIAFVLHSLAYETRVLLVELLLAKNPISQRSLAGVFFGIRTEQKEIREGPIESAFPVFLFDVSCECEPYYQGSLSLFTMSRRDKTEAHRSHKCASGSKVPRYFTEKAS